jgi:hypothetical protein
VAKCRAIITGHAKTKQVGESLPARTWAGMPRSTREVLIMLACQAKGDPFKLAMQGWDAFTDQDRDSMAACARMLAKDLRHAGSLF